MSMEAPVFGSALQAIKDPIRRATEESIAVTIVLFLVGAPNFLVSVLRWGFQWGTISKIKWLANTRGIAMKGFGIWVAIAAPTTT